MTTADAPLLAVADLHVRYGAVAALRGVSLTRRSGRVRRRGRPERRRQVVAACWRSPARCHRIKARIDFAGRVRSRARALEDIVAPRHRARARGPAHLRLADRRGESASRHYGARRPPGGRSRHRGKSRRPSRSSASGAASRPGASRAASSSSSPSPARCSAGRRCSCSTSRRSASPPRSSIRSIGILADVRARGVAILLVEQNAARALDAAPTAPMC